MQILPSASLKNNYLYEILIRLTDIKAQEYNFMIERISRTLNIFTRKIKDVMFLFLYHRSDLHFPVAIKQ